MRNPTTIGQIGKSNVEIGRYTYGIENLTVRQWGEGANLKIGSFCSLASSISVFLGGNHRTDWITTFPFGHVYQNELGSFDIEGHPSTNGDVIIGSDVWIGAGATIMSGITIGHGAVLSANSHIVRNVAPYEIVGGNPAKPIKYRFDPETIDALLTLRWWDLHLDVIKQIAPILSNQPNLIILRELRTIFKNFYETD